MVTFAVAGEICNCGVSGDNCSVTMGGNFPETGSIGCFVVALPRCEASTTWFLPASSTIEAPETSLPSTLKIVAGTLDCNCVGARACDRVSFGINCTANRTSRRTAAPDAAIAHWRGVGIGSMVFGNRICGRIRFVGPATGCCDTRPGLCLGDVATGPDPNGASR